MRPPLSLLPLLPIAIGLCGGILLWQISPWLLPVVLVVVIASAVMFRRWGIYPIALSGSALIGMISLLPTATDGEIAPTDRPMVYDGRITQVNVGDKSQTAVLTIDRMGATADGLQPCRHFEASITYPDFSPELYDGNRLIFSATLEHPVPQHDLPYETDYADILIRRHINYTAIVTPEDIVAYGRSGHPMARLRQMRNALSDKILALPLEGGAKELLCTTLTGNSANLSANLRQTFAESGLAHMLALSGLHVGLITFFLAIILWPLTFIGHRRTATVIIIILLWFYALLTGLSPSVTRAVIMATLYMLSRLVQRYHSPLNALCAAAILILIVSPQSLFAIGFQLSFAAVGSIIMFARILNPINPKRKILYAAMGYVAVSIAAVVGSGVVSMYYFHEFPLLFLPANLALCLVLPWFIGFGILSLIFNCLGFDFGLLNSLVDALFGFISLTTRSIAGVDGGVVRQIYISPWGVTAFVGALVLTRWWFYNRRRSVLIGATVLLTASVAICSLPIERTQPAAYIARNHQRTDFVIDNGTDTLSIVSTALHTPVLVRSDAERRYEDFIGRNRIKTVRLLTNDTVAQGFAYRKPMLTIGGKNILIASADCLPSAVAKVDYLALCRGFRGRISSVVDAIHPDTILIGYDLDYRTAARLARECHELGHPYISLRERPFSLPFPTISR